MARIFISYAHEDQAAAKRVVDALAREGLDAWWDHDIPPGRTWAQVIGERIKSAEVVIVIWSKNAVDSNFVQEEAQMALDAGKFLPVKIDDVEPPVGFRRFQAAKLVGWWGEPTHQQWRAVLSEIRARLGSAPLGPKIPHGAGRRTILSAVAALSICASAVVLFLMWPRNHPEEASNAEVATEDVQQRRATTLSPVQSSTSTDGGGLVADVLNGISAREWSELESERLVQRVLADVSLASLQATAGRNARAQTVLGLAYDHGIGGVPPDQSESVRLYRLAASQGFAPGQHHLAIMYQYGRGVARNDEEAVRLYELAANQGFAAAQVNLGWMYSNGRGTARDVAEAIRLYSLAVEQGSPAAMNNLGVMYSLGQGVAVDDAEAARLFRLASERGNPGGQANLGSMYEEGRGGLPVDRAEAVRLYILAARQGDAFAQQNLARLGESW